ncbi:hypothetical protein PIIN_04375 [Serendipita indica DSM 11827]|uniref:C2H2-type domain-containing protein n=1 Tax=Serendipita indica (strain DSM 11827) TaxID=1109443 RepID=G4TGJ3_SERID|nr:hypothetical protein PIIN_04375 [Serendipita indica DSM 11827]
MIPTAICDEEWARVFGPSDPNFCREDALLALRASIFGVNLQQVEDVGPRLPPKRVQRPAMVSPKPEHPLADALSSGKAVSAGPSNEATAIPAPEVSNPLVVTLVVDNREHNTLNDDESRVVEEHDAISGPFEQTAAQPPVQKGKKKAKASVAAKTTRATPKATAQPAAAAVRSQSRRVAAQIAAEHLEEASEETPAQTSGVFRFDKATEEKILDDLAADKWADARKHLPEEERPAMATDTAEVEELEVERKGTKKGSKKAVWVCRCTFSLDYARGRFSYGLISCGDRFASKDNVDRHIRTKHMGIKRK